MAQEYNLSNVLNILYRRRKLLLAFVGGVTLITIIVLLLIPNYYQGKTIFYAASEDLFKPQKIFGTSTTEMYFYGSSEDINRILTIGNSQEFVDSIAEKFDLYQHYGISREDAEASHKLRKKFFKHFNLLRTKYDALELTVEDRDPMLAASMANSARQHIQNVVSKMIKDSQKKLIDSYESSNQNKEHQLNVLLDSMASFQNQSGIYDPKAQAEFLSTHLVSLESKLAQARGKLKGYEDYRGAGWAQDSIRKLRGVIQGVEAELEMLTDSAGVTGTNLNRFNQDRAKVMVLEDVYMKATNQLSLDKEMLKKYQSAYGMDIPAVHILTRAEVPVVKSRPIRSLILLTVIVIAIIFSVIAILLLESYRNFDWKAVTRDTKPK